MLGIPTRTEAIAVSETYAVAIDQMEQAAKLASFGDVFSTDFANSHVAAAFSESGHSVAFTEQLRQGGMFWEIEAGQVPPAARTLLEPIRVLDTYRHGARIARDALEAARPVIDMEQSVIHQGSHDSGPLDRISKSIRVEETTADYVFEDNHLRLRPGQGHGWKYTLNPYEVATEMLNEFVSTVEFVAAADPTDFGKIASMAATAKSFESSNTFTLLQDFLIRGSVSVGPDQHESSKESAVAELERVHAEIAGRSDVSLRFDEQYFDAESLEYAAAIPAASVLDDAERFSFNNLAGRSALRQVIDQVLSEKGYCVINGTRYEASGRPMEGEAPRGYVADGETYSQIVNLLGKSVVAATGKVIAPEQWAAQELQLVSAYHDGNQAATELLLDRYGTTTEVLGRQQKLQMLARSTRNFLD